MNIIQYGHIAFDIICLSSLTYYMHKNFKISSENINFIKEKVKEIKKIKSVIINLYEQINKLNSIQREHDNMLRIILRDVNLIKSKLNLPIGNINHIDDINSINRIKQIQNDIYDNNDITKKNINNNLNREIYDLINSENEDKKNVENIEKKENKVIPGIGGIGGILSKLPISSIINNMPVVSMLMSKTPPNPIDVINEHMNDDINMNNKIGGIAKISITSVSNFNPIDPNENRVEGKIVDLNENTKEKEEKNVIIEDITNIENELEEELKDLEIQDNPNTISIDSNIIVTNVTHNNNNNNNNDNDNNDKNMNINKNESLSFISTNDIKKKKYLKKHV